MERTQIYLTEAESRALDQEASRTGRSKSELIRAAIDQIYLGKTSSDASSCLRETAGSWTRRELDGEGYAEKLRRGGLAKKVGRRT